MEGQDGSTENDTWSCKRCTFKNQSQSPICSMCGATNQFAQIEMVAPSCPADHVVNDHMVNDAVPLKINNNPNLNNNANQNIQVIVVQQPNLNHNVNQNGNRNENVCGGTLCSIALIVLVIVIAGLVIGFVSWVISQTCFDADSIVKVKQQNNNIIDIPLSDIKTGDYVLTLNPETNQLFWDQILIRVHYEWYDQKDSFTSMRTIYLENNISSITLSYDHFIFINDYENNKSKVIASKDVKIGESLFYFDENKNKSSLVVVSGIDDNVMKRYRVIFGLSQYVLINNIVASPFIGPHPMYHDISYKILTKVFNCWFYFMSSDFMICYTKCWWLIFLIYWVYTHPIEFCIIGITAFYFIHRDSKKPKNK